MARWPSLRSSCLKLGAGVWALSSARFSGRYWSVSRVYLGVHYLSEVLGAAAVGIAWLVLCLTAVDTLRRSRDAVKSD